MNDDGVHASAAGWIETAAAVGVDFIDIVILSINYYYSKDRSSQHAIVACASGLDMYFD
jgi:hypothetical protein